MPKQTFEQFIGKERERLKTAKAAALTKRAKVDEEIAAIDTELAAINAYETAKSNGKRPSTKRRARRNGRRAEVLAAVKQHPSGVTRGDLLQAIGVKGDRSKEQSVSNALAALKKSEKLTQDGNGRYRAV